MSWRRYVAIGDSLTEGLGDPDPRSPGEWRGWADRLAEELTVHAEGFGHANLAIRGRLLRQIIAEQLPAALAFAPDLVSISDQDQPQKSYVAISRRITLAYLDISLCSSALTLLVSPRRVIEIRYREQLPR